MTIDTDFIIKRQQAHKLASKFFVLLGQPERYNNTTISDIWDLEMLHVLKQPGITFDYAVKVLVWAFTNPFWSARLHIAKNFAENIDAICDAYDGNNRSRRLEEKGNCVCPTINGTRVDPDTDFLLPFDWKCPKHGKGGTSSCTGSYVEWVNKPEGITKEQWYEQRKRQRGSKGSSKSSNNTKTTV